ncbi:hypothetical protein HYH03_001430 [Edaphochlamys debaryana]|uniref:Ricin B lectin domain-containing protein n=1 Tax=Edaphochlamys debaryana TaxID=47281 RepID=A0A836C687_9CHLO|nr:hypothetical protein HYH03_001430 [Edaphochlamys debaryana]|eukprot:KAG2500664.1 hypothetical protein HYH03_001430 [Edaphochlamys debaryana]
MSAPLAAGHFALMRQEGFYPAGSQGPLSANFTPSGMLLKATAVAGAASLQNSAARSAGRLMGPSPDGYQGWGRLDLAGSLPLPGLTPDGMALQVADGGTIAEGQTITLTGLRSTGGAITAVMVYYDYPAELMATKQLVNDLDLYYSLNNDPTKRITLGDPSNPSTSDFTNPIERIQLNLAAGDNITFHVEAYSLGSSRITADPDAALPQRWALAVAFQLQTLVPLSHSISLAGGACLSSSGSAAVASSSCAAGSSTVFTITEEGTPGNSQANGVQLQYDNCTTSSTQLSVYLEGLTGSSGYRLKTTLGKCVGVAGASTASGAAVVLGDCLSDGGAHQHFVLTEYTQGFWSLAPKHAPAMCLSVFGPAGSGVTIYSCISPVPAGYQRFRFSDVPAPSVPSSQGYRYVVRESVTGKCLTAGKAAGSAATLAACDGSDAQRMLVFRNPHSANPNVFQLVPLSTFSKTSVSGRLCLRHTALGSPLSLAACDVDAGSQAITLVEAAPLLRVSALWQLPRDPVIPSASFRIGADATAAGICLQATSATNLARVSAVPCSSSSLQQWTLAPRSTDGAIAQYFLIQLSGTNWCIWGDDSGPLRYAVLGGCGVSLQQFYYVKSEGTGWRFVSWRSGICLTQTPPGAVGTELRSNNCDPASAHQYFSFDMGFPLDANGYADPTKMTRDTFDFDLVVSWSVGGIPYTITNGMTNVRSGMFGGDDVTPDFLSAFEEAIWPYDTSLPDTASYQPSGSSQPAAADAQAPKPCAAPPATISKPPCPALSLPSPAKAPWPAASGAQAPKPWAPPPATLSKPSCPAPTLPCPPKPPAPAASDAQAPKPCSAPPASPSKPPWALNPFPKPSGSSQPAAADAQAPEPQSAHPTTLS